MASWEDSGKSNEWYTPKYIFDALSCKFDLDVAAPEDRTFCCVPALRFITKDSIARSWDGFVWMNPPFGGRNGIVPWLDKMAQHRYGIALTPDRTSAPWWQRAAIQADAHLFINGKVKFIKPDGSTGESPSTGTTLFAYGREASEVLVNAQINQLGVCFTRISHVAHITGNKSWN